MANTNRRKHICTGLMAHVDSGKTTLSEALLYASGTIRKLGKVDTKDAFLDNSIAGIICAIGGDDTYRLLPYLMEDEKFIKAVEEHPKLFTGFSDTTINHLMFYKLGLSTYYGPNFICDL